MGMKGNNEEDKRYGESVRYKGEEVCEKVGSGKQIRGEYCVLGKSKNNNVNNMKNMKNMKNINNIEKHRRIMSSGVNTINIINTIDSIDTIDSIRDSIDISSRRVENGVRRWEKSRKEESNDKTKKNTQVCSECKSLGVINKDKNKNDIPTTQKVVRRQRIESPCTLSINNIISSKRYTNTNTNNNTNSNTHHHTPISPNTNRRLIPNNPQEQTTIHSNTIISPNPRSKRKEHKLQKSATQYINTRNQGLHTSTHRNLSNVGNLLGNHTNIRNNTNVGNLPNTTEGISTTTSHKLPPKGVNEEIRSSMQLTMHPRLSYYIRKVPLQPIHGMTTSTSITRSINMNTHNININIPQRSKTSLSTNTPVPAPRPTFDAYLNTLEDSFVLKTDPMQKLLQKVIISKDGSDPGNYIYIYIYIVVEEILSDGRLRYMKHLKEWNKIFRSSYYSQNYSENTKLEKLKEKLPSHTFLSELYMEHGLQREQNLWRECQTPHPTTSKLLNKNKKRTNSAAKHLLNNLIKNREGEMDNNSGDLLISGSQTISQNVLKSSMSSEKLKVLHENFIEDNEDINDTSIITPLHTVINNK